MTKQLINTANQLNAKRAISSAVKVNVGNAEFIYISGIMPTDESKNVVGMGDIEIQTKCVFDKLNQVLNESNATIDDLVKVNIFLVDIVNDFEKVSVIRNGYLGDSRPAATTIGITGTIHKGCNIEIDAVAVKTIN